PEATRRRSTTRAQPGSTFSRSLSAEADCRSTRFAPRYRLPNMPARGGIDLGGPKTRSVVVDGRNNVLGEARRPTPTDGGPPGVAEAMAECLREAADQAKW